MAKAVFLDRDGVINRAMVREGKPYPPSTVEETEILPDVAEALARLKEHGYLLIVITNQPDVARGTTTREAVEAINNYLSASLPIDEFRTCYHDSGDGCDCRKPRPGSLLAAAALHNIDMTRSFMIGDRWRDVEAGQNAGCKTIFIDYGYSEKQPEAVDCRVTSLGKAAAYILEKVQ
ncbi:D-glycero-D-manno-heptose 1,7-bisphosphate phosphatase [Rhizobium sp. BK313]|uniref:D-glycero-alpha-D-manno-heptose-1,7-bisphosphate 7-phosphatase n=1 Tax=Rhizobium sp. BK313 TaxID=2587081 RepID=UPI00105C0E2B|nr:HAD family hydrolase [Rhizobium sp. BK313]MBB3457303.1 D-glycero-D-manno-heptose 1,7-bisphosphate phosphatase [Rhizobium sp. BK313]